MVFEGLFDSQPHVRINTAIDVGYDRPERAAAELFALLARETDPLVAQAAFAALAKLIK